MSYNYARQLQIPRRALYSAGGENLQESVSVTCYYCTARIWVPDITLTAALHSFKARGWRRLSLKSECPLAWVCPICQSNAGIKLQGETR